ncbi:MAG TPA: hypothetical protein VM716_10980 [Gemmatimonadales bacterium]|nr:hypothetical protein [Gemmatimonadales bacterium]
MNLAKSVAGALLIGLVPVSAVLVPGATISVPSSTAATEPDLTGVVLHDSLIPFVILDSLRRVVCRGRLQDRVVRSNQTGLLHFYYRIRGDRRRQRGRIRSGVTLSFGLATLSVGYRLDGLGVVNPTSATRTADTVQFDFKSPLSCGAESRFFFIKTNAKNFGPGQTALVLSGGQSVTLNTVAPVP